MKLIAIILAIELCRPSLPRETAKLYAAELQPLPPDLQFMAMALVDHESRWVSTAVSRDGEDFGLGQIRARHMPGCRADADPVHHPSAACAAEQSRLLDGVTNLRHVVATLKKWRATCRKKTGKTPTKAQLLQAYGGYSRPKAGMWCGLRRSRAKAGRKAVWSPTPIPRRVADILRKERELRQQILAMHL